MNIQIDLSVRSVKDAQKRLRAIRNKYPWIKKEFVKRSLAFIEIEARRNIKVFISETNSSWYVSTGTLENSWMTDIATGTLENICDYAMWYEYGTGIVGANNSHPSLRAGYQYDVNRHGSNGWVYEVDGVSHFTKGMKAHPFLYNAIITYLHSQKYITIFRELVTEAEKGL